MSDSYLPENEPYRPAVDPFEGQPLPPRREDPQPSGDLFDDEMFRPTPKPPAPVDETDGYPDLNADAPPFDPFNPSGTDTLPPVPDDPHRDAAEAVMTSGATSTAPATPRDDGDEDGPGLLSRLLLPGVAVAALAVGFLSAGFLNSPETETVTETKTKTVEVAPEACKTLEGLATNVTTAGAALGKVADDYSKLIVPTFKAGQANNKARGAQILKTQKNLDATTAQQLKVITSGEFTAAVTACTSAGGQDAAAQE